MSIRRYSRDRRINIGKGTHVQSLKIKNAVDSNSIKTDVQVLKGFGRLDTIAGFQYGDSSLWWIIAAASGIGWGLQVPPGTRIVIPLDVEEIGILIG